jgi:hypothetical protein
MHNNIGGLNYINNQHIKKYIKRLKNNMLIMGSRRPNFIGSSDIDLEILNCLNVHKTLFIEE